MQVRFANRMPKDRNQSNFPFNFNTDIMKSLYSETCVSGTDLDRSIVFQIARCSTYKWLLQNH